jgi:hypothetical protein
VRDIMTGHVFKIVKCDNYSSYQTIPMQGLAKCFFFSNYNLKSNVLISFAQIPNANESNNWYFEVNSDLKLLGRKNEIM